jgi:hypothetical protein
MYLKLCPKIQKIYSQGDFLRKGTLPDGVSLTVEQIPEYVALVCTSDRPSIKRAAEDLWDAQTEHCIHVQIAVFCYHYTHAAHSSIRKYIQSITFKSLYPRQYYS